jgi:hypothetical protein
MTRRARIVLDAMLALEGRGESLHATAIAFEAGKRDPAILEPVFRRGNAAVKGSWSGPAARCHRVLGTLGYLSRQGYVGRSPRGEWWVTDKGRTVRAA